MPSGQGNILFLPHSQPSLREFSLVVRALLDQGLGTPVLLDCYPQLDYCLLSQEAPVIVRVRANGDDFSAGMETGPFSLRRVWQGLERRLFPWPRAAISAEINRLRVMHKQAADIIDQYSPSALLLSSDRLYGWPQAFVAAARDRSCPVLLLIFAVVGEDWFPRRNNPQLRTDMPPYRAYKKWLARRRPQQVYNSPHGKLLFYHPERTVALDRLHMLPAQPWTGEGSSADLILASGENDRVEHIKRGIHPEKVIVTGLPSQDHLYRASKQASELRSRLTSEYNLEPDRKWIVCALPYHAKQHHPRWESYWEEVNFLVGALANTGANILLSLHPKTEPEACLELESQFGINVLRQPMSEILPVADLLVASFSSTVRWAVLMGIPTLVFDFYRQRFHTYDSFDGVITVEEKAELPLQLQRLLNDEAFFHELCQGQMKLAARMAPFDGDSTQRIVKLLSSYC